MAKVWYVVYAFYKYYLVLASNMDTNFVCQFSSEVWRMCYKKIHEHDTQNSRRKFSKKKTMKINGFPNTHPNFMMKKKFVGTNDKLQLML